jgi:hypothetical protein
MNSSSIRSGMSLSTAGVFEFVQSELPFEGKIPATSLPPSPICEGSLFLEMVFLLDFVTIEDNLGGGLPFR